MSHSAGVPPTITLRDVTPDDRPFLLGVYASTRAEELAAVPWPAEQKEQFLRQQFEAQDRWYHEQYTDTAFQVVLADGVPAGRLYVARWEWEIRVLDIALLAPYRGSGIGTRIFHDVMREAAATDRPVTIHVEIFNPARRLYERLGFRPMGEPSGVHQRMEWRASRDSAAFP